MNIGAFGRLSTPADIKYLDFELEHKLGLFEVGRSIKTLA